MAVSYANVFAILGKDIKLANTVTALYSSLATQESAMLALSAFSGTDFSNQLTNVTPTFDAVRAGLLGAVSGIPARMQEILLDREGVVTQLSLGDSSDFNTVIERVMLDMIAQSKFVEDCTVTVGSVTKSTTNTNAGKFYVSKVLDQYNSPIAGGQPYRSYYGYNSELAVDETIIVRCISDDDTPSGTGGSETWSVTGYPPSNDLAFGWLAEGSGTGPTLTTATSQTGLLTNGSLDDFTTNTPDGWTIDAGTAGTHVFEETSTKYLGDSALRLRGNASLAAITLTQDVSVDAGRMYALGAYIQGNASLSAGTLTISFTGTGYTPGASEKISLNQTALAALTSYAHYHCFILIPRDLPSDFKMTVTLSGTPSAHNIYVDELVLIPATYHGGVALAGPYQGSEKFLKEDTHTFTLANDDAGVVQTAARRLLGIQFPSNSVATIADSVAT